LYLVSGYDPEFFIKLQYSKGWGPHSENVRHLIDELKKRFPDRSVLGIKVGHGALTEEKLGYKPPKGEKFGPDLILFHKYECLCYIEVSGSTKIEINPYNPYIWVLLGKYNYAKKKTEKYWFWMVYPNGIWLLDKELVKRYEDNVQIHYPKGVPEKYIDVPYTEASSKDRLFEWIEEQIT